MTGIALTRLLPAVQLGALVTVIAFASSESRAAVTSQGYVIHMFHPATYAQPDNCPKGGNGTEADLAAAVLKSEGYAPSELKRVLEGDRNERRRVVAMRGRIDGKPANAVTNPTSVPDPHIELVSGRFAYGFDLDGKGAGTPGSFIDPETQQGGVDNGTFRVLGCFPAFDMSLPQRPQASDVFWEMTMETVHAWLFVISGKDISTDGAVDVTFYRATIHPQRDRTGRVMSYASYVVDRKQRSGGSFKGEIRNGLLTVGPSKLLMEGELPQIHELDLQSAHLRLTLPKVGADDERVTGWLGGYSPWYSQWFELNEAYGHYVDEAGTYYAFRKLADADPDPATGANRRISTTYRLEATPAFVMTAEGALVGAPSP